MVHNCEDCDTRSTPSKEMGWESECVLCVSGQCRYYKWMKLKDVGYKVQPRIHDIVFHSPWNGCSKATEILPVEKSVFWLVPFQHPKTRKGAAIEMERNDENHRDAEWHLQGHSTTKLLSSYWSNVHFLHLLQFRWILYHWATREALTNNSLNWNDLFSFVFY